MLHGWGSILSLAANLCKQLHCQHTHLSGYAHCLAVDSASIVVMNGGDFIQCFLVQYILLIQRLYVLRIPFGLSNWNSWILPQRLYHKESAAAGSNLHLTSGLNTGEVRQFILFSQREFLSIQQHGA